MDGLGDEFFAGAGLSGDQHGTIRFADAPNEFEDLLHGFALADHVCDHPLPLIGAYRGRILMVPIATANGFSDDSIKLVRFEWKYDAVRSAVSHCLYDGAGVFTPRDGNGNNFRIPSERFSDDFVTVYVRKLEVRDENDPTRASCRGVAGINQCFRGGDEPLSRG